jgi:peptidoglycan/xylan/chitin deacetylase (PgdA/CDA1 family)
MSDSREIPPGLAMMYHYVRPDASPIPAGIRPMLASEFERQLDHLEQHYTIAQPDDFFAWLGGMGNGIPSARITGVSPVQGALELTETEVLKLPSNQHGRDARDTSMLISGYAQTSFRTPPKPLCLLTFDDGTRDHAEVVTPILARRSLGAVFFVLTGPTEQGLMPLTHAIHWLLSQPDEQTWQTFQRYAHDELQNPAALGDESEARRIYHYEPPLRARIKYAANMAMPQDATTQIVRRAAAQAGLSLPELARQWFVSADQIADMHRAGMTIGLHGHSHSSLQVLGPGGIAHEIAHGAAYLTHLTGRLPTWWACPFGGTGANDQTLQAMRTAMQTHNLRAAVTTQKSPVIQNTDPLAIPRYDCIDLPPRKPTPPPELRWT